MQRAKAACDARALTALTIKASDHLAGTAPAVDPNTARIAAICGDLIEVTE
jgi:hypothetical protein